MSSHREAPAIAKDPVADSTDLYAFLSPDAPFADQHAGNPQSWNLYTYTRNNPLNAVDSDGRQTVKVDAQMKLGSTQETVQVVAEVPLLETTASNFSHAVENRTIQEVPLQGRDLQQLAYLLPGVSNAA